MFSYQEVQIGRKRSARLRRLSGYLMMFVGLSVAALLLLAMLAFLQPGGMNNFGGWAAIFMAVILFLLGSWFEAISQSVADTYELVEDVHHTLRKQQDDKHAED